jgi:hypothetical protein
MHLAFQYSKLHQDCFSLAQWLIKQGLPDNAFRILFNASHTEWAWGRNFYRKEELLKLVRYQNIPKQAAQGHPRDLVN